MREGLSTADRQDLADVARASRRRRGPGAELVQWREQSRRKGIVRAAQVRSQFGPTACAVPTPNRDREYSADELELLRAVEGYKQRTGRQFPTVCEVLAVCRELGYRKP